MAEMTDREAEDIARRVSRRRRQAARAGLSLVEADLFAESDIPMKELRRLVELDCPKKLLAKILL